jgi:hypothetical protein
MSEKSMVGGKLEEKNSSADLDGMADSGRKDKSTSP